MSYHKTLNVSYKHSVAYAKPVTDSQIILLLMKVLQKNPCAAKSEKKLINTVSSDVTVKCVHQRYMFC